MPLLVIGINHRTAPVEIREKVVFAGDELPAALQELSGVAGVRESLIVSTCNRTELYCLSEGRRAPVGRVAQRLARSDGSQPGHLRQPLSLARHAGNPARLFRRVRPRLAGAGRAADPRPAQDRVSRRAGSAGHRPVPEPTDADCILSRQACAHADAHRRECRVGRIGCRCPGAQDLRGLRPITRRCWSARARRSRWPPATCERMACGE